MRQAHDVAFTIHDEFGVDRVAVPCSNGVPDMREAAIVNVTGKLGGHLKGGDELVHRSGIGKHWQ
jgi:hypothetical protein